MEPSLRIPTRYREETDAFGGLNRNAGAAEGEFAEEENLSSDQYPVLAVRPPRERIERAGEVRALLGGDGLIYVEGGDLVLPDRRVALDLSPEGEKRLCAMGSYILVFPDKKYASTLDPQDFGSLENEFRAAQEVTVTPCDLEGKARLPDYSGPDAPEDPAAGEIWLDTAGKVLKQWSAAAGMWVQEETGYLRLEAPAIGAGFRVYDGISVSGTAELEGANTLWAVEENALVVSGLRAEAGVLPVGTCLRRRVPDMDFTLECGNRLWGCRAGKNADGEPVNEIYASRLGDFRNWESYLGLTTDSYAVSVGAPGAFTGAVAYLGTPIFFKEDCLYKIFGSYPAAFRVQMTPCQGVQPGCGRSLAIAGETLYYKSTLGVCAYDGAMPRQIGQALGPGPFAQGVGAAWGSLYYLSMEEAGESSLFVFDGARGIWHRETGLEVRDLAACRGKLYAADGEGGLWCLRGGRGTEKVSWLARTGKLDFSQKGRYLIGIALRLELARFSRAEVLLRYDGFGPWKQVGAVVGQGTAFTLTVRPRRCNTLEIELRGVGDMRLYGLTRVWQKGGSQ